MNVYDIANDLAQQIKKSEEYVNYKMAREAIKLNSKLSEEIKNFDQLRYQTQIEVMQTGKNDPEKLQKVQDKYAELIEQNDAKRYFEAETRFNVLVADINKIIGEAIKDVMEWKNNGISNNFTTKHNPNICTICHIWSQHEKAKRNDKHKRIRQNKW